MADSTITAATALAALDDDADLFPVVDTSEIGLARSKKITVATLKALLLPKVANGASIENLGAVEENVETASVATTKDLDVSVYGVFDYTMTAGTTLSFINPAPSGKCSSFVLILRGAFTAVFPASVDWPSGTLPTYSTPSIYVFTTVDGGVTWLGSLVGSAFA